MRSIRNFKTRIKELDAFENKLCAYNAKMNLTSLYTLCAVLLIQVSLQLRFGADRSVFIIESAAAMVFVAAGTARFHYLNLKKYDLVKDLGIVTHKRAIVFDGIMHALGMILCWCVTYLPVLLDRSLADEKTAAVIFIPIYQPV
ncbi:MAG: hypothetical protein IKN38_10000, partial [Clostridia bacterium]|nr:hypothetical protein [Clostridia bacterium]